MKLDNHKGFTLVEALVAIFIFSILIVVVSGLFLQANRLHQNTASFQRLQNEGRYLLEKLAREIRSREIILPESPANPLSGLEFYEDERGQAVTISFDSAEKELNYQVCDNFGCSQDALNAEDVAVEEIDFYVQPTSEYFWGGEPESHTQPRVTVRLKLKNLRVSEQYQKELVLQTTVSSRLYQR